MDIKKASQKLFFRLLLSSIFVSMIMTVGIFSIQHYIFLKSAELYSNSIRNYALVGDAKEIQNLLNQSLKTFSGVNLTLYPSEQGFRYGNQNLFKVRQILTYGDSSSGILADFKFYYQGFPAVVLSALLFFMSLALTIIIFKKMRVNLELEIFRQNENEKLRSKKEMAEQVAHDLRSPLSALNILTQNIKIADAQQILFNSALVRINEILDDLLKRSALEDKIHLLKPTGLELGNPLRDCMSEILSEKELVFSRPGLTFSRDFNFADQSGKFIALSGKNLKRILSNLLNNSIEAVDTHGEVNLSIRLESDLVVIRIHDTGRGISEQTLAQIGQRGMSFDKDSSGLGIFAAMDILGKIEGGLSISSKLNVGTMVTISIPII